MSSAIPPKEQLLELLNDIIPPLTVTAHKGQVGRIGIVGGSVEYTGAPFYAAMTTLRMGADLAHIFCMKDAAIPIKSYSPEVIVHPVLDANDPMSELEEWLPRLHSLVLGPGLGRRPQTFATLGHIIEAAKDRQILLVIDADALFYLNENYDVIEGYSNAILTPNRVELARLYRAVIKGELKADQVLPTHVQQLASHLKVTILCKGQVDIITDGKHCLSCDIPGSPRRCGGQGDVLSGATAVLLYWAYATTAGLSNSPVVPPTVLAAWGASAVTRKTANITFSQLGRGTLTTDMLALVSKGFASLCHSVHK